MVMFTRVVLLLSLNVLAHASDEHLLHHVVLDSQGDYHLLWTPMEDEIIMELQVKTHGYVGLGFSPTGGMKDADFIIAWINQDGRPYLSDRYDVGNTTPMLDPSQDVHVLQGYKNNSHTIIRFSRQWDTCDQEHDYKLSAATLKLIWAYSDTVPEDQYNIHYHEKRGTKSVYLKEPVQLSFPSPDHETIKHFDVRSPNVTLPSTSDTLYWCTIMKLPEEITRQKTHFVGYKPLIAKEQLGYVHHIVMYECVGDGSEFLDLWHRHHGMQCNSPNMPPSWTLCSSKVFLAWAIGSEGQLFPEHVGFPLGDLHGGASYFMIEVHYDNPKFHEGVVDDSGLRLFYTEKLRKYDAGILMVGHSVTGLQVIPPETRWTTVGHCTGLCTKKGFLSEGIKVFLGLLHAHSISTSVTVEHIRKDRQLPNLLEDSHYDYNYQQSRMLPKEVTVLPGDHIITKCGYDSRGRNFTTFGGEGTREEMCLGFLSYYPAIQMGYCLSYPDIELFFHALQLTIKEKHILKNEEYFQSIVKSTITHEEEISSMKKLEGTSPGHLLRNYTFAHMLAALHVDRPRDLSGTNIYEVLSNNTFWKDEVKLQEFKKAITSGPYTPECITQGTTADIPRVLKYPKYTKRVPKPQTCSKRPPPSTSFLETNRPDNVLLSFLNSEPILEAEETTVTEDKTTMLPTTTHQLIYEERVTSRLNITSENNSEIVQEMVVTTPSDYSEHNITDINLMEKHNPTHIIPSLNIIEEPLLDDENINTFNIASDKINNKVGQHTQNSKNEVRRMDEEGIIYKEVSGPSVDILHHVAGHTDSSLKMETENTYSKQKVVESKLETNSAILTLSNINYSVILLFFSFAYMLL